MAEARIDAIPDRFEVRVTADTHFGWLRTRLSVERTLMSWVRTAVSLIGFGFAIVQFFDRVQQMPGVNTARFSRGALLPGPGDDWLRRPGACRIDLAVPMDASLPVERKFRRRRRNDRGGRANAAHRGFCRPHTHWHFRLRCRAAALHLAVRAEEMRTEIRRGTASSTACITRMVG